jgi:hypothetical protein
MVPSVASGVTTTRRRPLPPSTANLAYSKATVLVCDGGARLAA